MAQIYGYVPYTDRPTGRKQTSFWPLKSTIDSGGEFTVLTIDTEISVDATSGNIDNLFIASTDGTVGNARYIKVNADGTVQITGSVTISGNVGILNSSAARIDPSTEDKQDDIISKLSDIEDEVEDHESYKCLRFSIADGDSTTINVITVLGKAGRFIRIESTQDLRLAVNGGDVIHISDSPWTWDKFKFSSIYIENPSGYGSGIAEVQVIITG